MTLKPRFLFHANASSIGGRIGKPKDIIIETPAASSLSSGGGRSIAKAEKGNFGDIVRFGSASTFAEGVFDDLKKWSEVLCGDLCEDTLTATTRVSAEVRDLSVNAKAPFTAKRINSGFTSKSAKGSGEPTIRLDDDTVVEGAALGGHKIIVEINSKLFQRYDTLSKLRTAADDPKFVRENGGSLFMKTPVTGRAVTSPSGRFVEAGGVVYGTIVQSIRWADKPYPGAVIDQNVITIPDCGEIYFGEIMISRLSRRLSMLRIDYCCPAPMRMMCSEPEDNGGWPF